MSSELIKEIDPKQYTILVVDDSQTNLKVIVNYLREFGFKLLMADSGENCLKVIQRRQPDLILLDIMMPILDGFETIKKIRINIETKDLVVYAITAQAMIDDLDIIKNNGFDDLITKPVNASTLSFKIQQAIQKRAKKS